MLAACLLGFDSDRGLNRTELQMSIPMSVVPGGSDVTCLSKKKVLYALEKTVLRHNSQLSGSSPPPSGACCVIK